MPTIDMFDYMFPGGYSGTNSPSYATTTGSPIGTVQDYWYRHINGDIEWFNIRWNIPSYMTYIKYYASEGIMRFVYDCENSQPNLSCGESGYSYCYSMWTNSSRTTFGYWANRYMDVGATHDGTGEYGASWNTRNKTICSGPMSAPQSMTLSGYGTKDFGGDIGNREYITLDLNHGGMPNTPGSTERYWYAKYHGLTAWDPFDRATGVHTFNPPTFYNSWGSKPSGGGASMIDFASVCPSAITPPGPYLSATNGGGGTVIPNRAIPASWETFTITPMGGIDTYSIKTSGGEYLTAANGGGGVVTATATSPSTWETFHFIKQGDGYYAIKCYDNSHYLQAASGGESSLVASSTNLGVWEKFGLSNTSGNNYYIWTNNYAAFGPEFSVFPGMPSLSDAPSTSLPYSIYENSNGRLAVSISGTVYLVTSDSNGQMVVTISNVNYPVVLDYHGQLIVNYP